NVDLPAIHLANGLHQLMVGASNPNGGVDTNPLNDEDSVLFMVNSPGFGTVVKMNLDRFGSETTWQITSQEGFVMAAGGPYNNSSSGYTVNTPVCLAHDCYTFTVMDAVGDGMCCNYGLGNYLIADSESDTLLAGTGTFQWEVSNEFCVNWVGIESREGQGGLLVAPNPGTGRFTISFPQGGPWQLQVLDALGRPAWTGTAGSGRKVVDLGAVANGTYVLVATDARQRQVQRVVVQR
ncbi:MAG TPA: T9SS type A sorting domain-containing protein, partial [Flavobacteriales bacterium]|nr:T9SS type A sorting domain-containing protein [Flavobacteriales bacterium]